MLDKTLIFIQKHKYGLISIGSVFVLVFLWWLGSVLNWFNPVFIPSIGSVKDAFLQTLEDGYKGYSLLYHIGASMKRLFIAVTLAFIAASVLGLVCGMSKVVLAVIDPFIEFYRALPPLAYNTLIVLWLGIGDESKIALLFLSAFAPIFIQTVFGVQRIPRDRINGARSLGADSFTLFFKVIFPSALPDILTGLRTAVGVAYATLVAAEMVASASGIGWMVLDASKYILYPTVYFGIIIMGLIAILIDLVLRRLILLATPWQRETA
ncbi:MAG: ABC transporter permease [Synergistaceae bacterium]|nr:ABC transporter permease [Synergistaceae bacterium]